MSTSPSDPLGKKFPHFLGLAKGLFQSLDAEKMRSEPGNFSWAN